MYFVHRQHFDVDGKCVYSIFEGSVQANRPLNSITKAENRRNEILWAAIQDAQRNFIKYEVQDNGVIVHYAFGQICIVCEVFKLRKPNDG